MPAGSNFGATAQAKYGITLGTQTTGQTFIYKYMATATHIIISVSIEGKSDLRSIPTPTTIAVQYPNLFTGSFSSDAKK